MARRRDDPFDNIEALIDRMRQEFEDGFPTTGDSIAVDVRDMGDAFVVTADLPGCERNDIDVRLADSTLHLEASPDGGEAADEDGDFLRRERTRGPIRRAIRLPGPVDASAVEASYATGVLTVRLPKRDPAGGTRIDIE